jgi:molybdate transport system substrate-binding protein
MWTRLLAARRCTAMILLVHGLGVQAAEVTVMATGHMRAVLNELGPQVERETGHKIVIKIANSPVLKREIEAGEVFDLLISIDSDIDALAKAGKIAGGTRVGVAFAAVGVGVRAGAPKPDMGSVNAFKRMLLNAASVAYDAEGASSVYFNGLVERLGIVDEMNPKLRPMAGVLKSVASGETEFGIASIPAIVAAPGIELVGVIPEELQTYINLTAGVSTSSGTSEAAQALVKFLIAPKGVAIIKAKGLESGVAR